MKNNNCLLIVLLFSCFNLSASPPKLLASLPPFPPFYYDVNQYEECRGVGVRILDLISEQAGIKFEVVNYPYARIIKMLKLGKLEVALLFKNKMLVNDARYIGPVTTSRVLVTTINNLQPKSYQDLYRLRGIAVIRKAGFNLKFDQDNQLKKIYVESYQQGLKMLKRGRVEAIIGSILGLSYGMKQLAMDTRVLETAFYIGDQQWWFHFSNRSNQQNLSTRLQLAADRVYQVDLALKIYQQQYAKGCY